MGLEQRFYEKLVFDKIDFSFWCNSKTNDHINVGT